MESVSRLLKEFNQTQEEYEIKNKQYSELRSILLQDASNFSASNNKSGTNSTSSKDNVLINKRIGCTSNLGQGKIEPDGDTLSIKKMVKNRIREYNSIKSNSEKFKCNDKEKLRFMDTLQLENKDNLTSLHLDSIQKLINTIQE